MSVHEQRRPDAVQEPSMNKAQKKTLSFDNFSDLKGLINKKNIIKTENLKPADFENQYDSTQLGSQRVS